MFPETNCIIELDCPVCYNAHDEDIHQATLRLRGWFHQQVTHRLEEEEFFCAANVRPVAARVA